MDYRNYLAGLVLLGLPWVACVPDDLAFVGGGGTDAGEAGQSGGGSEAGGASATSGRGGSAGGSVGRGGSGGGGAVTGGATGMTGGGPSAGEGGAGSDNDCGDGTLDPSEACDDGNLAADDGCSPSCSVEDLWSCTPASPSVCSPIGARGLRVQLKTQNVSATYNTIYVDVRIFNERAVDVQLGTLALRYWFSSEAPSPLIAQCNFAAPQGLACSNIDLAFSTVTPARTMADAYCEMSFSRASATLAQGGYAEVQTFFHYESWSDFTQTNDYSYNGSASYSDSIQVTLYEDGQLAWGVEP